MTTIQCLMFDLGNVITYFDHDKACRQLAGLSNGQFDETQIYAELFKPDGLEQQYDRGAISTAEFIAQLKTQFQLTATDEEIETAWCDMFWPNESIFELIPVLSNMSYQLLLASNTNELHYRWVGRRYADVLQHFHIQVPSHLQNCRKPERTYFQRCIEKSGCAAEQCVFIDDKGEFVAVAREVGMHGVTYTSTDNLMQRLAELGIKFNL